MSPLLILVLVVVGLLVVAYLVGMKPEPTRGRPPPPAILRRRSRWRKWLPVIPLLAAAACLVLAFTGFSLSLQETVPTVVLVMDASDSMNATDVAPNRLAAAEAAALAFLDELPDDFRVGLVTFAGETDVPVPPTEQHDRVADAMGAIVTERGTVIGDGLDAALDLIGDRRDRDDVPAAAVLLSDGRDTGSTVLPQEAAERARSLEVPVFTVVVGQVDTGAAGGADLETLEQIAETSGGETFTAETADELTSLYETLGSELSVELDVEGFSRPLVIVAIALTILAGLMLVFLPR